MLSLFIHVNFIHFHFIFATTSFNAKERLLLLIMVKLRFEQLLLLRCSMLSTIFCIIFEFFKLKYYLSSVQVKHYNQCHPYFKEMLPLFSFV